MELAASRGIAREDVPRRIDGGRGVEERHIHASVAVRSLGRGDDGRRVRDVAENDHQGEGDGGEEWRVAIESSTVGRGVFEGIGAVRDAAETRIRRRRREIEATDDSHGRNER